MGVRCRGLFRGVARGGEGERDANREARLLSRRRRSSCPVEAAVRRGVARRVGYDPFFPWAKVTVVVRLARQGSAFVATIDLVDDQGIDHGASELRAEGACDELLDAVSLAVAIAVDPRALDPGSRCARLPRPPLSLHPRPTPGLHPASRARSSRPRLCAPMRRRAHRAAAPPSGSSGSARRCLPVSRPARARPRAQRRVALALGVSRHGGAPRRADRDERGQEWERLGVAGDRRSRAVRVCQARPRLRARRGRRDGVVRRRRAGRARGIVALARGGGACGCPRAAHGDRVAPAAHRFVIHLVPAALELAGADVWTAPRVAASLGGDVVVRFR